MRPAMQRKNVVLPQPLGPTMQRISWLRTSSVSARNATTAPSRNSREALCAAIALLAGASTAMRAALAYPRGGDLRLGAGRLGSAGVDSAPWPAAGGASESV